MGGEIEEEEERGVNEHVGDGSVGIHAADLFEWVSGWVGGWVEKVEEEQAVRMRCCGFWVGGWVGR